MRLDVNSLVLLVFTLLFLMVMPNKSLAETLDALRISGADKYSTAAEISRKGWEKGADTVVLSRGDSFPDALAGSPLAYHLNAPILLTAPKKLPGSTLEELRRLKPQKVIILGGTDAISEDVKQEISKIGITTERISGKNRYETSIKIANKLGASKEKAILATGTNFPDALAIAPYAAENGYPILLTNPGKLDKMVSSYLKDVKSTIIVGGKAAVKPEVEALLPSPERISGETRYETAAQIISSKYETNSHIYISTGNNFADALTGSVLAAKNKAAILLVGPNKIPPGTDQLIADKQMKSFQVFGGKVAVSDDVVSKLNGLFSKFKDSIGTVSFTDGLKVLDSSQIEAFESANESLIVNLDGSISMTLPKNQAQKYNKADLFYLAPTDQYPTGFFGQISSLDANGNLTIDQPAIDEVFKDFNIHTDEVLTPDRLVDVNLEQGVALKADSQKFYSFSDWINASKNKMSISAEKKPILFEINKTLYEDQSKGKSLKLAGGIAINSANADMDLNKKFGIINEFDYHFDSAQDSSIKFIMELNGKMQTEDQSKNKEFGDWLKLEGVDREGRVSLATMTYQVGTAPVFGPGNRGYIEIPIGVTVFLSVNVKGEAKLTMELGVIEKSDIDVDVEWKDGSFDSEFNLNTDRYTANFEGKGEVTAAFGAGFEPALNIGGLLPAVVQNDLSIKQELKGNVKAEYDFKDTNFTLSGCFENTFNAGFESNLKIRLKASSDRWNIEEKVEYEKNLFEKDFFKETKKYCENAGKIKGNVVDAVTKEKLSNVKINAYQDGEFFSSASTDEQGDYEIQLSDGVYTFEFSKLLYKTEEYKEVKINENEIEYSPSLRLIGSEFLGDGEVSGEINNSINGQPIQGASITIRSGLNTTHGDIKATVVSNADGHYTLKLPAGLYTAEITKQGYISSSIGILSIGNRSSGNQNATLSPLLDQLETRIVLKWGEEPSDLDSHLTGPAADGERFHIYYGDRETYENEELMAKLDVDDTDSFGPETITILKQQDGVYRYSIHDFSNNESTDTDALSKSGAVVEVYRGSYLIRTFHVPANRTGTLWTVFELDGSTIVPINEISNAGIYSQSRMTSQQAANSPVDTDIIDSLHGPKK
ncbi:cell wall-binding repeat-containing protein [Metabacillus dongyingensis]|uniref:cell wall-binding repeat-containing protein n=1 Tax=Metabacillus dongyingensis TaxID=2874282 RepID=UPI003B8D7503